MICTTNAERMSLSSAIIRVQIHTKKIYSNSQVKIIDIKLSFGGDEMRYESIRLEKGMYQDPSCSFSQVLESVDPSSQYVGTNLEGLDAFQRQLKRFGIKVKGAQSDTVEKFFAISESAVLFPEYVARAVRHGIEESDIIPMITASITQDDSLEDQADNTRAKFKKRGRMLVASYEAVRKQKIDWFSVILRQIGAYISHSRLEDAVDVLLNGDCNSRPAEVTSLSGHEFGFDAMLDFWTEFGLYEMNTMLVSNNAALTILKMPELQKSISGFNLQYPCCGVMPFGAKLIRTSAVPPNTVVGLDKRFALEMVQVGEVAVEYDKLIDRQFERAAITTISGFSKIYEDASKVLNIAQE